jgi:hypothetical protein
MSQVADSNRGSQVRDTQEFRSKRDSWLVTGLLVAAICMASVAVVLTLARPAPRWLAISVSALLLVAAAFVVWVLSATSYRISDTTLLIRCGPLRRKLDLDDVDAITPSHDLLAGPALSLDRLRVIYRGSTVGVLVSPQDRDGFLDCCASHCRHLRREGDHLVRAA